MLKSSKKGSGWAEIWNQKDWSCLLSSSFLPSAYRNPAVIQTMYKTFFTHTHMIPKEFKSGLSHCNTVCNTICKVMSQMGSRTLCQSDWMLFKRSVSQTAFLEVAKEKKRLAIMKAECRLKASDLQCTHIHLLLRIPLSSHFVRNPRHLSGQAEPRAGCLRLRSLLPLPAGSHSSGTCQLSWKIDF